jgi:adenylate kinase
MNGGEPDGDPPQGSEESENARRLLLIGPPGSGKGTVGQRLAEQYGVEHIAAGDLLRHQVETKSDIGRRAAESMQRGELVSDSLVYELVLPRILVAGKTNGYVLDGFPRTLVQAEVGRAITDSNDVAVTLAILLDAEPDVLIPRLLDRARNEDRIDDTPEVIRARLDVFNEEVEPLLDFYRELGLLVTVDASGSPEEVWVELRAILDSR